MAGLRLLAARPRDRAAGPQTWDPVREARDVGRACDDIKRAGRRFERAAADYELPRPMLLALTDFASAIGRLNGALERLDSAIHAPDLSGPEE